MSCLRYSCALLVALCLCISASANSIYDAAYRLKSQGKHAEAVEGFLQAAEQAKNEGNARTEFSCYYGASYSAHFQSKHSDCSEYAEKALSILAASQSESWASGQRRPIYEIELVGLIERSYFSRAQLGEGWKVNRRGVELLRKYAGTGGTGHLKPEEVLRIPRSLRSQGWRFIEREAYYLYETGDSSAARELLEASIEAARADLEAKRLDRSFYPLKLIGLLGILEGFVGNEVRAIELYEQEYQYAEKWSRRSNLMRIRFNCLAEIVDYQGADDAIVEEAEALLKEAEEKGMNTYGSMKRIYDRIAAGRMTTEERIQSLVDAASLERDNEQYMDSFFSSRNALFVRAANNEPDLDEEFMEFLRKSRSQGNLRAEPRIYRRYGDWLRLQRRYSEAIRMYQISLERSLVWEWHSPALNLYCKLAATYLDAGESEMAFEMIQAMEAYFSRYKDFIEPHSVVSVLDQWILALLKNGSTELAKSEAAKWHQFGVQHSVPELHLNPLSVAFIDAYLERNIAINERPDSDGLSTLLHPLTVTTVGVPDDSPRASFFLMNPSAVKDSGLLQIYGKGLANVSEGLEGALHLRAGSDEGSDQLEIPLSLIGGTLSKIYVYAEDEEGEVRFQWEGSEAEESSAAKWNYSIGEDVDYAVVIEAAEIKLNSFIGLPVEHLVYFGGNPDRTYLPVRIRAEEAFRIEYRDSTTGRLIAVDNNGNGNFSESGDFWVPNDEADEVSAPVVLRSEQSDYGSIEVWYFPNEDLPQEALNLTVEVYQSGEWAVHAVDQIQL